MCPGGHCSHSADAASDVPIDLRALECTIFHRPPTHGETLFANITQQVDGQMPVYTAKTREDVIHLTHAANTFVFVCDDTLAAEAIEVLGKCSFNAQQIKSDGTAVAIACSRRPQIEPSGVNRICSRAGCCNPARRNYCDEHRFGEDSADIHQDANNKRRAEDAAEPARSKNKARRLCSHVGCTKQARSRGLCIGHGGGKRCTVEGCENGAQGTTGLCSGHGGGGRCTVEGCKNGARGTTGLCSGHGGGQRCTVEGCKNGALGTTGLCKGHGGGKRCTVEGCEKSALGTTGLCSGHGGGERCTVEGCKNGALGTTGLCSGHGGGERCTVKGCKNGALGTTGLCGAHGGGNRCQFKCCNAIHGFTPALAIGRDPETGKYLCTQRARYLVNLQPDHSEERARLMHLFGFKKDLVLRAEHTFYHHLNMAVPELRLTERVLDASIFDKMPNKQKSRSDDRPDYYHFVSGAAQEAFAVFGEFDENPGHENSLSRLVDLSDCTAAKWRNTYVFRVLGHLQSPSRAVAKRRTHGHHSYFELTDEGLRVVQETAAVLRRIFSWIESGLAPNDAEGRPQITYINGTADELDNTMN